MTTQLIDSAIVIGGMLVARWLAANIIRRKLWTVAEEGRRWLVVVRNLTLAFGTIALIVIWSDQLAAAALSLVAFAVALVFAGTEILKALSASFVRANSRAFTIGDRIQVGEVRGEVIDATLMTTTVLEVGRTHVRTGRTISIPNGLFLTEPVINETRSHKYVLHTFVVSVPLSQWREAHGVLYEAAVRASEPVVDDARRSMVARAKEYALPMPIVEPFVMAKPGRNDTVDLTVRLPAASGDTWRVEDVVTGAWLQSISFDHDRHDGERPADA